MNFYCVYSRLVFRNAEVGASDINIIFKEGVENSLSCMNIFQLNFVRMICVKICLLYKY